MNGGRCSICEQRLTDASGNWVFHIYDRGIFRNPTIQFVCCAYCQDRILGKIKELRTENEQKKGGEQCR